MKISLVVPVFNEEDAIPIFYKAVREYEPLKPYEIEIVFIDDGSKDSTKNIINMLLIRILAGLAVFAFTCTMCMIANKLIYGNSILVIHH